MSKTNNLISEISAQAGSNPQCWLLLIVMSAISPLTYGGDNPIYLRAQHITVDQRTGLSTYQGKVHLKRGKLSFIADKATVKQRNSNIDTIRAFGNPVIVRIRDPQNKMLTTVNGERLLYLVKRNLVIVTGKVIVRQGNDVIKSAKVTYHINDDTIMAEGLNRSTPIKATFQIKRLATQTLPPPGMQK